MISMFSSNLVVGPWQISFTSPAVFISNYNHNPVRWPFVFFDKNNNYLPLLKATENNHCFELDFGPVIAEWNAWTLTVKSQEPCGIMWPDLSESVYFGEIHRPIDRRYSVTCAFGIETDDPTIAPVFNPVVTHQDKKCFSLLFDQPVKFCSFRHKYQAYCNATCSHSFTVKFIEHQSRSTVLIKPPPPRELGDIAHPDLLKEILFSGAKVIAPLPLKSDLIATVNNVQNELSQQNISSAVIGSLALRMWGINIPVQDADMLVERLPVTSCSLSKWKNIGTTIERNGHKIDLSVMDELNLSTASMLIDGVRVLSLNELLNMKMLGECEKSVINPGYINFSSKNLTSIYAILQKHTCPKFDFLQQYLQLPYPNLKRIITLINQSETSDLYAEISYPMEINTFNLNGEILLLIVNNGEPVPGRIYLNTAIRSCQGIDLVRNIDCSFSTSSIYTEIKFDQIHEIGIIQCQTKK
jgi:hypothetical protein